ncbi:MAG: hypothetical protein BGO55_08470 [Sphingobacteriales bacterium 50-39]|nr:MAG: hypothetical protein BGO55_08470 [Sphingobacteriales bacterium 50-39]
MNRRVVEGLNFSVGPAANKMAVLGSAAVSVEYRYDGQSLFFLHVVCAEVNADQRFFAKARKKPKTVRGFGGVHRNGG